MRAPLASRPQSDQSLAEQPTASARSDFTRSFSNPPREHADTLIAGEVLTAGQQLDAPTQGFSLLMRGDGNLVVYRTGDWSQLWSSDTQGNPEATAVMLDNGDLTVTSADGQCLWSTATCGNPGAFLQLHDNGTLVAYSFYRDPLWSSAPSDLR